MAVNNRSQFRRCEDVTPTLQGCDPEQIIHSQAFIACLLCTRYVLPEHVAFKSISTHGDPMVPAFKDLTALWGDRHINENVISVDVCS